MVVHFLNQVLLSVAFLCVLALFLRLYNELVAKPDRLRAILMKQGLRGPPPIIFLGNILKILKSRKAATKIAIHGAPQIHDLGRAIFPFFDEWIKQYGEIFIFSVGNVQFVSVTKPDMVREIFTCTSLGLGRPTFLEKDLGALLGQGILTSNGASWAHQRKILAPELYLDKVKGMISLIQESANTMIDSWKSIVGSNGGVADIKIDHHIRSFSGDVISRACFGSSYEKGEEIFSRIRALQEIISTKLLALAIPGVSKLPTRSNMKAWALDKEIRKLILKVVNERQEAGYEKDLLQMILEAAKNSDLSQEKAIDGFIVDNCKNIYLAGYETTAVSTAWCLMLLAANPDWQDRIRSEVLDICRGRIPDDEMIRKMKLLTMAINESLRLYPPVTVMSRELLKDMKFGEIHVPKGVNLWTLVTTLHTDPAVWGPDSYKFNPQRFANGITGACKLPYFYVPFGVGPRVCLGQHLAVAEMKILITLIVSNFSFSLSPEYIHSPALHLVTEPGHGVNLLLKML